MMHTNDNPSPRAHRTPWRLAALLAVLGLGLAACGSDDDGGATGTTGDDDVSGEVDGGDDGSDEEVAGGAGEVITVLGTDFDFEGLPDTIAAGTRLALDNDSAVELHEIVAFRIDDDRSVSELLELPEEELMPILGFEPRTVILTPPGGDQIDAVGDGTLEEPGRYALLCAIPTGIDPGVYLEAAAVAGEGPPMVDGGGAPHFVHGMYAEVTVQ